MKNITDNRPHILVATTAFAPFIGGAEVAVQEIMQRTSDSFRYTVVTARMDKKLSPSEKWNGIDVIRVGWGMPIDKLWLIVVFPWYAWKLRPQLVWAIMASYAGAAACLSSFVQNMPYVLTLQEGDDLDRVEHRLRFVTPFFRQIFARAQSVHTIAKFLGEWAKKLGAKNEPLVVPNGVSCDIFSLTDAEREGFRASVREKYSIPHSAFVVLSVSRLVEKNGIGDLIAALKFLPDAHLLLVGDGKLHAALAEQCGPYRERVHFLGTQQQGELKQIAAAADVFCRPAHSEGQGIAFLEALCMGLPVVATNVGGIPEIIEHSVHGLLVEPHHIEQLAEALAVVQGDQARRTQMITAGSNHVKQFSWDLLVPQIKNWLSSNIK